ncbi:MAG TPA: hypothetical protein VMR19_00610 [Candidatus Saccharimonadales bacterium]|jgi:hypothetical protein|nr:hypothetical protein [Candidatus Saccharimonadales bacterium]
MKEKPILEEHYGKKVWVNPFTDSLRGEEGLCYHCDKYLPGEKNNCPISKNLFKIAQKEGIAMIVTRCPVFDEE